MRGNAIGQELSVHLGMSDHPWVAALIYEGLTTDVKLITSLLPGPAEIDEGDFEDVKIAPHEVLDHPALYDQYVDWMRDAARQQLVVLSSFYKDGKGYELAR